MKVQGKFLLKTNLLSAVLALCTITPAIASDADNSDGQRASVKRTTIIEESNTRKIIIEEMIGSKSTETPNTPQSISKKPSGQLMPYATSQSTYDGSTYYELSLRGNYSDLQMINKVTYFLNHPTFEDPYMFSTDQDTGFSTGYYGWGCLTNVEVTIDYKNGAVQRKNLNMCSFL